jgi:hypothetical protein
LLCILLQNMSTVVYSANLVGMPGSQGAPGAPAEKGATGATGMTGAEGAKGEQGGGTIVVVPAPDPQC